MRKSKERRRALLGAGAYEGRLNGEDEPSTKDAQGYFLEAVTRLVPEIIDDLSKEPFGIYKQVPEFCFNADKERFKKFQQLQSGKQVLERFRWENYKRPCWENIETAFMNPASDSPSADGGLQFGKGAGDPAPVDKDGRIAVFYKSLVAWSERHNLDERWCRERAYDTLEEWSSKPEWFERRYWKFQINYPHPFIAGGEPTFVFERRTQYPLFHLRKADLELAVEEFKRQYGKFQDELEARFKGGGYTPAPLKPLDHHFEWLVRYHVQGWSYAKTAEHYGIQDDSRLRHRVPEVARLINLTLKKRRGRPRKL
jgi:hypothetical protein